MRLEASGKERPLCRECYCSCFQTLLCPSSHAIVTNHHGRWSPLCLKEKTWKPEGSAPVSRLSEGWPIIFVVRKRGTCSKTSSKSFLEVVHSSSEFAWSMAAVGVNLSQMALCAIGPRKALTEACKVKIQQRSGARQRSSVDTTFFGHVWTVGSF